MNGEQILQGTPGKVKHKSAQKRKNMDKRRGACYTLGMQAARRATAALAALTGLLVFRVSAAENLSQWDVEGMYVQARAMLEDRSIQNVASVPMLLETCAREGHAEATRLLLDVYEGKFKGLEANLSQAAHLARALAESQRLDQVVRGGSSMRTEAMFRLALYLEKGSGCEASPAEASEWMERAARRGMPRARVELARYLMNGSGVKADPQRAWKLLHTEARENPETPHIFFYMGYMCERGVGMPRSPRKAFELYRMGARLNDAQCLNNLGTMFEKGYPTPRDTETALRLYRKAAHLGNKQASANMQRLAFKEGIRAGNLSSTPATERIDNATLRIIQALPVTEDTRERLRDWLRLTRSPEDSR